MEGYELDEMPFYTSPNGLVKAFKALSKERDYLPVTVISVKLLPATYQAKFVEKFDAILNSALQQVKEKEQNSFIILEVQISLKNAPGEYVIFHAIDTLEMGPTEERIEEQSMPEGAELLQYLQVISDILVEDTELRTQVGNFELEEDPFYMNYDRSVRLYKAVSSPIIVKRHEIYTLLGLAILEKELANHINAGLAQARAFHSHTCKIIGMHMNIDKAPKLYFLDHVLEALDRDVGKEIDDRKKRQEFLSEWELWSFLS